MTAFPTGMREIINLMAAKTAIVGVFVIFLSPLRLLYYRRANSTDNITPTADFKASSEADIFCGLMEILTPVALPAIL